MKTRHRTYPDTQKTKPGLLIFAIFLMGIICCCACILLFELFKETGSLLGTMLLGFLSFGIIGFIIYWMLSDSFSQTKIPENNTHKKLRKGRNSTFLEKHLNQSINFKNHQNYYTNASIVDHLKKQLFWSHYSEKFVLLVPILSIAYYFFISSFYTFFSTHGFYLLHLFLLILSIIYLYRGQSDYTRFKKIQESGNNYFLSRNISRYYFYNGDLFLY